MIVLDPLMARPLANLPLFVMLTLAFWGGTVSRMRADAPEVLVLLVAEQPELDAREQRFVEELGLALEGMELSAEEAGPGFAKAPLSEQLIRVRARSSDTRRVATLWLTFMGDAVLLHLVALQTERALVRIVQAKQRPTLEAELALLARELLGEAYLFARDTPISPPVEAAIARARSATRSATRPKARYELQLNGEVSTPLEGGAGPGLQAGAGLGLGLCLFDRAWVALSPYALAGPSGDTARADLRGRELGLGLTMSYRQPLGKVELGPSLRLTLGQRRLDARTDDGAQRDLRTLAGRIAFGAELGARVSDTVRLWLDVSVGARLFKTALRRASDQALITRAANLDGALRVGLSLQFP